MDDDDPAWRELSAASCALLVAAGHDRLAALGRQMALALRILSVAPPAALDLPECLWDEAATRAAVAAELACGDSFSAWRLGRWALRLHGDERAAVLDQALDAFERLIPTPVGPGNDAGPFCEIADALSETQTRRALAIAARMRSAGWGMEADAAVSALAVRLARLGQLTEARALVDELDEDERRWFGDELSGTPAPAATEEDDFADLAAWNEWLLARVRLRLGPESFVLDLTHPHTIRGLVALVGPGAIDVCRAALLEC